HNRIDEIISTFDWDDQHKTLSPQKVSNFPGTPGLGEIYTSILNGSIPSGLEYALDKTISVLREKHGEKCFLAVRSSAQAEDREFSFAGQFDTVLNVPLENRAVQEAYKRVVASLFSDKSTAYHQQLGIAIG